MHSLLNGGVDDSIRLRNLKINIKAKELTVSCQTRQRGFLLLREVP